MTEDITEQMISQMSIIAKTDYPKAIKEIETWTTEGKISRKDANKFIAYLMFYKGYLSGSRDNTRFYMKQLIKISEKVNKITDEVKNRLIQNLRKR